MEEGLNFHLGITGNEGFFSFFFSNNVSKINNGGREMV